jgi:hypothetical protein
MKFFCLLLLFPLFSSAHPGIGIVRDRKGMIYYTDLVHVWRIAHSGKAEIIIPNVHTHELSIDGEDNLYGENQWYNGERLNTWGHFIWKWNPRSGLDTIYGPDTGFVKNYGFTRDGRGNVYWAERFTQSRIKMKRPDGTINTLAEGKFGRVNNWMYVTPEGTLYFIGGNDLYRVPPSGKATVLVKNINATYGPSPPRHSYFGMWSDRSGHIYLADYAARAVKQVTETGIVRQYLATSKEWGPTGGVFDDSGNLWLMEWSTRNEMRMRKITDPGMAVSQKSAYNFAGKWLLPVLVLLTVVRVLFLRWKQKIMRNFAVRQK